MVFSISTSTLLLTFKCNFRCKHCSVNSSPDRLDTAPDTYIEKFVIESSMVPSIKLLAISGGEATLFPSKLISAVKLASSHGIQNIRLVTNAWWGCNEKIMKNLIKKIIDYGVNEVNISYDIYHIPYLDKYGGEKCIINAIKFLNIENIKPLINIVYNRKSDLNYFNKLKESIIKNNLEVYVSYGALSRIMRGKLNLENSIGSKTYISASGKDYPRNIVKTMGCSEVGSMITMKPDGSLYACCGHILELYNADPWIVKIGHIKRHTVPELASRLNRNILIQWLKILGPHNLAENIKLPISEDLTQCEACALLSLHKDKIIKSFSDASSLNIRFQDELSKLNINKYNFI